MPNPRTCRGCGRTAAIEERNCSSCGVPLPSRLDDAHVRAATEAMLLAFQSEMGSPSGMSIGASLLTLLVVPGAAFWWFARDSRWLAGVAAAVVALLCGFLFFGIQLDREARKSFDGVWKAKLRQFSEEEGLSKSDLLGIAKTTLEPNGAAMRFLGEL